MLVSDEFTQVNATLCGFLGWETPQMSRYWIAPWAEVVMMVMVVMVMMVVVVMLINEHVLLDIDFEVTISNQVGIYKKIYI